jgi:hypothetical protein
VISLLAKNHSSDTTVALEDKLQAFRSPIFLIGKVLNALLLDPLDYDLQVLSRFNRLLEVLESTLSPADLQRMNHVMQEERGLDYRRVDTLVFRPSRDIGELARERARHLKASVFSSWLLARTASLGAIWESDLLSFILFDAEFARQLVQLGRDDTVARAEDICRFFRVPMRLSRINSARPVMSAWPRTRRCTHRSVAAAQWARRDWRRTTLCTRRRECGSPCPSRSRVA